MEIKSKLIENVALRILTSVCDTYPEITWAKVKVSKMNPPVGGKMDNVSITITTDNL